VRYLSFVIFKLICIFGFMLKPCKVSNLFPLIFIEVLAMLHLVVRQSDVIEVKERELFQFCDLKTNLHIQVHAFSCSRGSD
jgi:hypothetical protein